MVSRFKFVGNVSHNLEAAYTKVKIPVLVLIFRSMKITHGGVSVVILLQARDCSERIMKQ